MTKHPRKEQEPTVNLIPETDAPLKAAAMIFPFLTTVFALIIIDSAGNRSFFPALEIGIGISAVIAILERVSSSWMQASRESTAMEIRRRILGLAAVLGISLLAAPPRLTSSTSSTPLTPGLALFSLYAVQLLITSSMGKLGKTLPILNAEL